MLPTRFVKANTGSNFLFMPSGHSTKRASVYAFRVCICYSRIACAVQNANGNELSFFAVCLNGNICLVRAARSA
jgi:hypothetical protein